MHRGLKNRHLQMIALGGAIGTGLFYGSASTISMAGPAVILSYFACGIIIFFIMRMLGEMSVDEPVAGSFSHYAAKYWGPLAGFIAGWNYWFLYVIVSMAELTAVSIYVSYWLPDLPHWVAALVCLIVITAVNLINVRMYGEIEFFMSMIKVTAIISMIILGLGLLLTDARPFPDNFSNLWINGGFFPNGVWGMVISVVPVLFSFGGIELIGITAGEAENPDVTIPRAINQVIYRILIFYVGTMTVLMALWPWNEVGMEASPFVQIFDNVGIPAAAHILNFVVLAAAVSVYNSAIYSNSRMLYSLARTGGAPSFLSQLSARKVPVNGILLSSGITLIVVALNYFFPGQIFMYLLSVVTCAVVISWFLIVVTHLKFKQHCERTNHPTKFHSIAYPLTNYLCMAVVVMMSTMEDTRLAVIVMPIWLALIFIGYRYQRRAD